MNFYQMDIVFSILRITFLAVLFFIFLPRIFTLQELDGTRSRGYIAEIILSTTFVILLGYVLEFFHFYDTMVILFAIIFFVSAGVIFRFGGLEKFIVLFNIYFLRHIETSDKPGIISLYKKFSHYKSKYHFSPEKTLFLFVFIIAAAIRLWPVFKHASPFAVETFQTIESVKNLELNHSAFEFAAVPVGMQILIDFVYQITRTDVGIVTHLFGIISTLLLMYAIYFVINSITENGYAAILGASILGIFTHLLPISINQQIEAESISLAAAIAVPTIFYGLQNFILKKIYFIIIFISGAISVFLISRFVTVMLFFAVAVFFLVTLIWRQKFINYLHINFIVHLLLFLVPFGAMVALQSFLARDYLFLEKARFFFYNEHFIRYAINHARYNEFAFGLVTFASSMFVLLLAVFDKNPLTALSKSFSGFYTLLLLMLWQNYWLGLRNILDWRQVGLFIAVFECINIGIIFNYLLMRVLPKLKYKIFSIRLKMEIQKFAITFFVIISLWIVSTPGIAAFNNIPEPDGFTKGVYKIKKKYTPYQWTAVSHFGTRALVLNSGRFMDYGFFLQNFSPETIHNHAGRLSTTRDVFIFAEKDSLNSHVDTALLPNVPNVMNKIMHWCQLYSQLYSDMSIFYEDKWIVIYHIRKNLTSKINGSDKQSKSGTFF